MSSGNLYERLFKLWASVCKLVLDDKRSLEYVCEILQSIVDGKTLVESKSGIEKMIADWVAFYEDVFGLKLDFSGLKIPERQPGFDRLLIVAQGMTPQRLFDKCKELFLSWKYTDEDLDRVVKSNRTATNGHYAVWVRDRVEADEENKNLSADDLKAQKHTGITLEERELYELKFFKETGKHLDIQNWSLCAGSRHCLGVVPCACWRGQFRVDWDHASYRSDDLRSRSVVS